MASFAQEMEKWNWEFVVQSIASTNAARVEQALARRQRSVEDFAALISPAAAPYLEEMARQSQALTLRRFGRTIQLYVPLYLSNECTNVCTYCGFSLENKIPRRTLTQEEILTEARQVRQWGFEHVLLVTGEAEAQVGPEYFRKAVRLLRPQFAHISLEVQPLEEEEYAMLAHEGISAVIIYQETYNRVTYRKHHPKGKKSIFDYRLDTPDRLGRAGMHKIGLGCLIGLEDWRADSFFTALHLRYMEKTYWKTRYAVSFPRLRPHVGRLEPQVPQTERELAQLICAWRLFDPDVELALSTRESSRFRDHMMTLGITHMSAGSRTDPGGYTSSAGLEQFSVHDNRHPEDVAAAVTARNYEVVWKDWDAVLQG